jgi:preprotein translocase subunit YajC
MIAASSSGTSFFLIIIVAFLLLWLIVVRPQRRRQSQQQQMLSELRVGDEVLTAGGIYGEVTRLDEDVVTLEIAPELEVRVARRAIAVVVQEPEAEEPDGAPEETDEELEETDGEPEAGNEEADEEQEPSGDPKKDADGATSAG